MIHCADFKNVSSIHLFNFIKELPKVGIIDVLNSSLNISASTGPKGDPMDAPLFCR